MDFLKKIIGSPASRESSRREDKDAYWVVVRCQRCGEVIRARINLYNDLSAEYDGGKTSYVCRKLLMGESRCFQQIEVLLKFDENRRLLDRAVSGGEFVDAEQAGLESYLSWIRCSIQRTNSASPSVITRYSIATIL